MLKLKPTCVGKCDECFFQYINRCVAMGGEDFFLQINEKQVKLIMNNKDRFDIPIQKVKQLRNRFPQVEIS